MVFFGRASSTKDDEASLSTRDEKSFGTYNTMEDGGSRSYLEEDASRSYIGDGSRSYAYSRDDTYGGGKSRSYGGASQSYGGANQSYCDGDNAGASRSYYDDNTLGDEQTATVVPSRSDGDDSRRSYGRDDASRRSYNRDDVSRRSYDDRDDDLSRQSYAEEASRISRDSRGSSYDDDDESRTIGSKASTAASYRTKDDDRPFASSAISSKSSCSTYLSQLSKRSLSRELGLKKKQEQRQETENDDITASPSNNSEFSASKKKTGQRPPRYPKKNRKSSTHGSVTQNDSQITETQEDFVRDDDVSKISPRGENSGRSIQSVKEKTAEQLAEEELAKKIAQEEEAYENAPGGRYAKLLYKPDFKQIVNMKEKIEQLLQQEQQSEKDEDSSVPATECSSNHSQLQEKNVSAATSLAEGGDDREASVTVEEENTKAEEGVEQILDTSLLMEKEDDKVEPERSIKSIIEKDKSKDKPKKKGFFGKFGKKKTTKAGKK